MEEAWDGRREFPPTARPKLPSIFRRFVYDSLLPLLSRPVYYLNAWNRLIALLILIQM